MSFDFKLKNSHLQQVHLRHFDFKKQKIGRFY